MRGIGIGSQLVRSKERVAGLLSDIPCISDGTTCSSKMLKKKVLVFASTYSQKLVDIPSSFEYLTKNHICIPFFVPFDSFFHY